MHTFVSVHSTHSKGELVVREVRVIAPLRNKTADALLSSTPPASDSVPGAGAAFLSRQGGRAEGAGAASELDADHLGEVADRLGAANSPVLPRIPAGAGRVVGEDILRERLISPASKSSSGGRRRFADRLRW